MVEKAEKKQKTFTGKVVSDKMDKTIVVSIERSFADQRTGKVVRTSKKYKVHDENQQAKVGDIVEFHEGRPLSKEKYMYLSKVTNQLKK